MSRVFLAHDKQLQREVVVKVLSPELLDEARVERFRQEVLQTARLQHPTIIPVLDVGAIESAVDHRVPYYIMPYARGESLRSRLHHEGQLSLGMSMRVLRSLFDALAYAHAHGVIHRDIKPENIFLSGTNALLADFGIAKAIAGPGSKAGVTSPGMAVGTPTYMAPEQILDGDRIGPRADLYSAGVVGFEMLTGKLPWGNLTPVETLALKARGQVTLLRSIRPDVPTGMASVIESCLAWEQERRPESAAAALQALESVPVQQTPDTSDAIGAGITTERVRRRRGIPRLMVVSGVVVLMVAALIAQSFFRSTGVATGYRNLSVLYPELPVELPARDDLAAQLYHMMTATLAPVSGLRLVGQVSVPQMTRQGLSPRQIVDSLRVDGVETVLELKATTSTDGTTMLAVELYGEKRESGETIAGPLPVGALDRVPPEALALIVRQLAAQSVARLHLGSANRAASETQRIDAYMAWLSGRDARDRRTADGLRQAIDYFERAITLDTAWAQAHADLAQTMALVLVYHYGMKQAPYELAARALQLADRAVMLQPEFADGYLARGLVGTTVGAPVPFIKDAYEKVAKLLSANPYSQTWTLGLLGRQGQFADAAQRAEEEVRRDPRSAGQRMASAMYALAAGQYITAVRNASELRTLLTGVSIGSQLELWGRLLVEGEELAECASVPAGPYLGARALCLERIGRAREGRATHDSLFAMLTDRAAMDSTFDLALPYGEMALYKAQHGERDATRLYLRQVFAESPAGIDYRLMRAGMFDAAAIAYADSLQQAGWARVSAAAASSLKR